MSYWAAPKRRWGLPLVVQLMLYRCFEGALASAYVDTDSFTASMSRRILVLKMHGEKV
jgi:hypothetical protein